MLTKQQREIMDKQLKAKTAPRIVASMLGGKTIQELRDNEILVKEYAKAEGLPHNDEIQSKRNYGG